MAGDLNGRLIAGPIPNLRKGDVFSFHGELSPQGKLNHGLSQKERWYLFELNGQLYYASQAKYDMLVRAVRKGAN